MECNGMVVVNERDFTEGFWRNYYEITLSEVGPTVLVNADNEDEALDYAIDYAEGNLPGLVISMDDERYWEPEALEDLVSGGNHGVYLSSPNIHLKRIPRPKEVRTPLQRRIEAMFNCGLASSSEEAEFERSGCDWCNENTHRKLGADVYHCKGFESLDKAHQDPEDYYEFDLCGACLNRLYNGEEV